MLYSRLRSKKIDHEGLETGKKWDYKTKVMQKEVRNRFEL
jgi:hypothetical protein